MSLKLFVCVLLLATATVKCEEEENEIDSDTTIQLDDSNFDEILKTNNFFVMFFAPW